MSVQAGAHYLEKAQGGSLPILIELVGRRRIDASAALLKSIDHPNAKKQMDHDALEAQQVAGIARWVAEIDALNGEIVSFFDVTAWNQMAENIGESITKGMRVVVYGRLDQRSWENQDGDRRSKVEIIADDVAPSLKWATASLTNALIRADLPVLISPNSTISTRPCVSFCSMSRNCDRSDFDCGGRTDR